MKRKKNVHAVLFHVGACVLGFFMIYPLLWLLSSSFKSNDTMFTDAYSLIPKVWDAAANYKSGFEGVGGVPFTTFLGNTVFVTVIGTFGCVFISLLAAYAFTRIRFKGSNFLFGCVMMTMMIPPQVMVVPQYIILKKMNLIDTRVALIMPWFFGGAFFIFLLVQFFRGIPKELDEAAKIDGATEFQVFRKVVLPMCKPIIATVGLFAGLGYWNDWTNGLYYITDTNKFSIQQLLNNMIKNIEFLSKNANSNINLASVGGGIPQETVRMAIAIVGLLPILIVFPFVQKYFVKGISIGAVKG